MKIIPVIFGLGFAGIGITVLVFLWGGGFAEFGEPPLFFRVIGSFIAVMFVVIGGGVAFGVTRGFNRLERFQRRIRRESPPPPPQPPGRNYRCRSCGANITDGAEVSPSGDVKCEACGNWFNVHQA